MARKKSGRTSEEKGVYIPVEKREPYAPENIKLSKKQFVEQQRIKKERALKVKEYEEKLKREALGEVEKDDAKIVVPDAPKDEPVKAKPKGRPKSII